MADCDSLKVPFSKPSISKEEEIGVLDVLRSGWLTTGKHALAFEKEFSYYMNKVDDSVIAQRKAAGLSSKDVINLAVNSATSGMVLAMEACGVKEGTAVITTPYTFVSTAACAKHLGAEVLFADIEKDSYSIDVDKVESLLAADKKKKIVAVVPVHIAGNVCDMERLVQLAHKYKVKVIEDAAHAFPSLTKLGYAGTICDAGVFSFYVTKTMTTAEGGMVCVRDQALAKRMTVMRMHGMDRTTWDRYTSPRASWEYDIVDAGWKFNLPDLLAVIGRVQLARADDFFERRKKIVQIYNKEFSKLDFVQLPPDGDGNAWHLYLARLNLKALKINRDEFALALQKEGIGISVHFIPLFHFKYWQGLDPTFRAKNFPNAERQYKRTISLPLWPDMTEAMAKQVVAAVKKIGEANHA
ncbi:MAG: DegT/DnrJ/EryC1/StrS aminotransferase family protein [Treponema sp.]|nr:DegT/DnrJ/EryC1/StrS aminotransferase family protein [Treponema sp.]